LRIIKNTLRILVIALLLAYGVAALGMLVVRFWVVPHVNNWRPQIEQRLSVALDAKVTIDQISASWSGLNPTLAVQNLRLVSPQGEEFLRVPDAFAVIGWRSLFVWDLRLKQLEINGFELSAERRTDGSIVIAGQTLSELPSQHVQLDAEVLAVRWLLDQGHIQLRDAQLVWHDRLREAPPLALHGIDVDIINSLFSHQLRIRASLPSALGTGIEFVAKTQNKLNPLASHEAGQATLFFELDNFQPSAWAPWLDLPKIEGRVHARLWSDVSAGHLTNATVELAGSSLSMLIPEPTQTGLQLDQMKMRVVGFPGDVFGGDTWPIFSRSPDRSGLTISASGKTVQLQGGLFEPDRLTVDDLAFQGQLVRNTDGVLLVTAKQLGLKTAGSDILLAGTWSPGGDSEAGLLDLNGTLTNLPVANLHQYVTTAVDTEARKWLRDALKLGSLTRASVRVQGDLTHFPFNRPGQTGVFKIESVVQDLVIDYDVENSGKLGWPALILEQGVVTLDKLSLDVRSSRAALFNSHGGRLAVQNLVASVPDLESSLVLTVQAQTQNLAEDYLRVLRATPLAKDMPGALDEIKVSGSIVVPLSMKVDLITQQPTFVQGAVQLSDNAVSYSDDFRLDAVQGSIAFTDESFNIEALRAQFLGGAVRLTGGWGRSQSGLSFAGDLTADGLRKLSSAKTLTVFTGKTKYAGSIKPLPRSGFDVQLTSPLEGIAIKLPAPLGKSATQRLGLSARWTHTPAQKGVEHALSVSFGDILSGRFERTAGTRATTFFNRAALATGAKATLPTSGFVVDLKLDRIDWEDWKVFSANLSESTSSKASANIVPMFQQFKLSANQLLWGEMRLTNLTLAANKQDKDKWSAQLKSKETEGFASWQEAQGAVSGRVYARFSKLALGSASTALGEPPKTDMIDEKQWSEMPAVDLTIDDFTLFGSRLGTLRLVGATVRRGEDWKVENLEVKNPYATLSAKGDWRLSGPNRGVSLDAKVDIVDLGKLSDMMGYPDRVKGGQGALTGSIDWGDFPWVYRYGGLNGKVSISLKDGVFAHVTSRSARLLELLSLQSLQRLLSLNFRVGDEFKDGFPWNTIAGNLLVEAGVVKSQDLVVRSPVASITLTGGSDLDKKVWDMQADVRPRFDLSGTAVATAFVVNPLAGLSALLTQYVLRNPIEKAMSVQYRVIGPWDDPILEPIEAPALPPAPVLPGG
jgi:uncharacterized protein (TIGR02099 family)